MCGSFPGTELRAISTRAAKVETVVKGPVRIGAVAASQWRSTTGLFESFPDAPCVREAPVIVDQHWIALTARGFSTCQAAGLWRPTRPQKPWKLVVRSRFHVCASYIFNYIYIYICMWVYIYIYLESHNIFFVKRPWPFFFAITALIVWSHLCESYGFLRPFFNKMLKNNTVLLRIGLCESCYVFF